jgi:hypothetical protein
MVDGHGDDAAGLDMTREERKKGDRIAASGDGNDDRSGRGQGQPAEEAGGIEV